MPSSDPPVRASLYPDPSVNVSLPTSQPSPSQPATVTNPPTASDPSSMPSSDPPVRASLYPDPSVNDSLPTSQPSPSQPATVTNPPTASDPSSSCAALPPTYELLLELPATLTEAPPTTASSSPALYCVLSAPLSGPCRIVQGPRQDSVPAPTAYHAFLSLGTLNIPLLPTHPARCLSQQPPIFELRIPHRTFTLRVDNNVESELVDALQRILRWFCGWKDGDDAVSAAGGALPAAGGAVPPGETPPSTPSSSQDRFARAGDKGVDFVERMGTKINNSIQKKLSVRVDKARDTEPKNVKLGGGVTQKVLGGARVVVGKGAAIASFATDKISGAAGKGFAKNPITKSFSEAPEGSGRRKFHDNLMAGLLAFGRIYVAADTQGKIIISDSGHGAAEYAGATYGEEAEQVARKLGYIALDGYRIARFPEKLGATAVLKGALKSTAQKDENAGKFGVPGESGDVSTTVKKMG